MSQRGPAPRSSLSPAKDHIASSPASQRSLPRQDDSSTLPPHEPTGFHVTEDDERRQSRTSGVHNILNPPEPARPTPDPPLPVSRPAIKEESPPRPVMGSGRYPGSSSPSHHFMFLHQGATTPQQSTNPTIPPPALPPGPPPLLGHHSPSATHLHLAATRRILTPRSPRAASLSRAAASRAVVSQHSTCLSNPPRSAPLSHEIPPLSASPGAGGESYRYGALRGPGTTGPPPSRPNPSISRSLSQPMIGHGVPAPRPDPIQPASLGRGLGSLPSAYPAPGPHFPSPSATGGGGQTGQTGPGQVGDWRWGPGPPSSGQTGGAGARSVRVGEGHQHLVITPDHGEKIVVPVNTHEGSKMMNEKRLRNAGASARFRHRKKIKEAGMMEDLQKLEAQNRELVRRIKELEEERDFYKNGGREGEFIPRPRSPAAIEDRTERGLSSPLSPRSGGSYPSENSPLPAPSTPSVAPPAMPPSSPFPHARNHTLAHPHPPPMSYGDPSMLERPARRRRIDSAPELISRSSSHRTSPPASLPPIPHQAAYGMPHSPHMSGPAGLARLPPLRFDQPPLPSTPTSTPPPAPLAHPPPVPQQMHPRSSYPLYSGPLYEMAGWATGYREQQSESGPK